MPLCRGKANKILLYENKNNWPKSGGRLRTIGDVVVVVVVARVVVVVVETEFVNESI